MRILYHHRTRSTDAQRVHILEMIKAFRSLGHEVEMAALVHPETALSDAKRDAGEAWWKKLVRRIPWGYEAVQLVYNLVGIPLLIAGLLRRRPDFIYERYSLYNFAGVIAARLFRIPIVIEVNSPFALEQKRDGDIRGFAFAAWSERAICNGANYVVVVSSPLRRIMAESGVRPEKIVVMTNGIDLDRFRPDPGSAALRARLGLEGKTVVGFVGWFRKWHGLDMLLQAFDESALAGRGARLLMIGDGFEMENLQRYVEEHRLQESVIFTGPLPHDEVPPYLGLIDIAVQPAANEYCCPLKILEYMGMGKPIVAPRQENIEELMEDGVEGVFFTPGDGKSLSAALTRMAADPDAARTMGMNAYQTILRREFLWTANARRVVELVAGPSAAAVTQPARAARID
jgi:glycosyltransferase involved in cell wall biosynthesis